MIKKIILLALVLIAGLLLYYKGYFFEIWGFLYSMSVAVLIFTHAIALYDPEVLIEKEVLTKNTRATCYVAIFFLGIFSALAL